MRQAIATAPRDGQDIVVEDDARAAYDIAHWSSEQGAWVWKSGKPIQITPTHWSPITGHEYFQEDEQSSSPFKVGRARWAATTLVAAALIGVYFRAEIVAFVTRYADLGSISRMSAIGGQEVLETERRAVDGLDLKLRPEAATASQLLGRRETAAAARGELDKKIALSRKSDDEAAQRGQAAEAAAEELKQSLQQERQRATGLASELAAARGELDKKIALSRKSDDEAAQRGQAAEAAAEELKQSLQQERQRATGLASELAAARGELDKKIALSRKSDDEAAQRGQAAEAAAEELKQSLQQERQRAAGLASELAAARSELEKKVALSRKLDDEAAQRGQAAEARAEELQQSVQQEGQRAAGLASELAAARSELEKKAALSRKSDDEAAQRGQAAEAAAEELKRSLQQERQRAAGLASELAAARSELEKKVALSPKSDDEAAQRGQAAEAAAEELKQSVQQERQRAAGLTSELAAARSELEKKVALSRKLDDEAAQRGQAAEAKTDELQQSLQQERQRAAGLASELAAARGELEKKVALSRKSDDEAAQRGQAAEAAAEELKQSLQQERQRAAGQASELAAARGELEKISLSSKSDDEAAQRGQAAEAAAEELKQSLQQERQRAAGQASELAAARGELEKRIALSRKLDDEAAQRGQVAEAKAEELQQSLQQERQRAAGLASELAAARGELKKKVALSPKSDDEAAQRRQTEAAAEELQQSLQQERQRAAALMSELAAARSELEKKVALSRKSDDEAARRGQAAEELKQSLQQERQRAAARTPDLESTQGVPEVRMTQERTASSLPSETTSVAEPAAAEQPVAAGAKVDPEAARLTARASILLAQGNIGAARLVLERAAEMGSAKASFALAETYDPRILSSWGAYGTRGDAAKAREFYAKATVGGIQEAKDRLNALRQ